MLKILVIDDEEQIREMISLALKTMGYHVVKAKDGAEGIRKFSESLFDIVITDFFMPFYNGDEVASHIRKTDGNIPIICITGTPEAVGLNFYDIVLEKPCSLKKLTEYIKAIENSTDTTEVG
jgi:DNA-binding response OmpR family regulator